MVCQGRPPSATLALIQLHDNDLRKAEKDAPSTRASATQEEILITGFSLGHILFLQPSVESISRLKISVFLLLSLRNSDFQINKTLF